MNNDLISREALKKVLGDPLYRSKIKDYGEILKYTFVMDIIDNAPTVVVGYLTNCANCERVEKIRAKRPHGKWKDLSDGWQEGTYECSNCKSEFVLTEGTPEDNEYHYCPNCGADMRGDSK